MNFLQYTLTDDLILGINIIDMQHREFFGRLNRLLESIDLNKSISEITDFVTYSVDYLNALFLAEEKLLSDNFYPDYNAHKRQHNIFRLNFQLITERFKNGRTDLSGFRLSLMEETGDWLVNHIRNADRIAAEYLKNSSQYNLHNGEHQNNR